MDMSVIIPARNEQFLARTIESLLATIRGNTEIIAVLDGAWADPPINDHPRVHLIHHSQSIGQRAATNEAVRFSQAKFVMKVDAHCAFDEGFDVKLMADCQPDWTVIPRMYNLHAFDWQCVPCGNRWYQGPRPESCNKCTNTTDFQRAMVWQPRLNRRTDFARFDHTLHFQYWGSCEKRPPIQAQGDLADVMCCVGAAWMMHRQRYWDLEGMDEAHGSWGQMGVEVACKTWLSGGRQVVNKKTWFAHLFRTQPGFGFPYPNPGIEKAREHSRRLWIGNTWPKQIHPLSWLLEKFAPIPGWHEPVGKDALAEVVESGKRFKPVPVRTLPTRPVSKGLVYYTDNRCEEKIVRAVQQRLLYCSNGNPIVSVSLAPVAFGTTNIVLPLQRGILTMFKQILAGLEALDTDVAFLVEHDVLYHPSHFEFTPPRRDAFYYNENGWRVDAMTGQALFYFCKQTSGLCAYRNLLIEHYRKRVAKVEKDGFSRHMGFEPGCHSIPRGVDNYPAEKWMSVGANLDIRHTTNLTKNRWRQDQFNDPKSCLGWQLADDVPGWGRTKGRFQEILEACLVKGGA